MLWLVTNIKLLDQLPQIGKKTIYDFSLATDDADLHR